jgi:hypothetical protein
MRKIHRTRLSIDPLEGREMPACIVTLVGTDTINITGNNASDVVVVNDNGAGTIWGTATGAGAFMFTGIQNINISTNGGHDRVTYNLVRNLLPEQQRVIDVDLSRGDDTFTANLFNPARNGVGSDLLKNSMLSINAAAGHGNDRMVVNAQRDVDIASGAGLRVNLDGNEGGDLILGYYRGENDGRVSFDFDGGIGGDTVRGFVREDAGSVGASEGTVFGGDGNDKLALWMATVSPPAIALIDGGLGVDSAVHTANVTVVNVP